MALGIVIGCAAPAFAAAPEAAGAVPYIEVTAEAETRVPPDLAYLDFGVMTRAEPAASAARDNAGRMKTVLAAVRATLPKAQIGTGTYQLRAEYGPGGREGGEPRVIGYVASNVVRLETAELTRLGEVIDAGIKAGANQVQRIAFGLSDSTTPRRSALREATAKAHSEAEAIAAALKLTLGPVQSVTDQDLGSARPFAQEAVVMRSQPAATTPIEPGVVPVRARVVLRVQIAR
jgi:uncharacterized protein YggE